MNSQPLIDPVALVNRYYSENPNPDLEAEKVSFGTSGHRGTPLNRTFTESHVLAIAQAVAECRKEWKIDGPLFVGMDTHCLSQVVQKTAVEVLVANGVDVIMQPRNEFTPTPSVSLAILRHNRGSNRVRKADGLIITPSHNPPEDAGIKYNPPHGGPAESSITKAIQDRANQLLKGANKGVKRAQVDTSRNSEHLRLEDMCQPYVDELSTIIDIEKIAKASLSIGVHPLGGSALGYWERIASSLKLSISIVDRTIDPTFAFMSRDHDGKIRMDCSSAHAMHPLISVKDSFDLAFANDPDADRHGIVAPSTGLIGANFFLATAIDYLLTNRPKWRQDVGVGKTVVSSRLIDRVIERRGRRVYEVPVGFKWFAQGLAEGTLCFGGEESAGASFVRFDGSAWSTDKDGIAMCLLAAEIRAVAGDLGAYVRELFASLGEVYYARNDVPFSQDIKTKLLEKLRPSSWQVGQTLGEDRIVSVVDKAPGNGESIGGLKLVTTNGWVAGRPSGTEPIFKIYAESDVSEAHRGNLIANFASNLGI